MKILVYGWYNHNNLGDESYKISFTNIWPQHEFFFTDNIKTLTSEYDICVIGGGDVVREEILKKISSVKCKVICISVSITPQSLSPEIHNIGHIYVRDKSSLDILLGYGYKNATYIPDISIIIKGNVERGKSIISSLFEKESSEMYQKVYTIVINSHLMGNSHTSNKNRNMFYKMIDDMSEVIDKTPASFLFLPFSTALPWDDRVSNSIVNSNCKFYNKNCMIYDKLSVFDSTDIISASDAIITTRYHGMIFGVGNNVPTCMISSHDKMSKFCEDYSKSYINYWSFSVESFVREMNNMKILSINTEKIKEEYRDKVYLLR